MLTRHIGVMISPYIQISYPCVVHLKLNARLYVIFASISKERSKIGKLEFPFS